LDTDIIILGAGLTGLSLAYYLRDTGASITILEGRDRLGGRIYTKHSNTGSIELGATWFSAEHRALRELLVELEVASFEQIIGPLAIYEPLATNPPQLVTLPANQQPSYRIKEGTSELITQLDAQCTADICLNEKVTSIEEKEDVLQIKTEYKTYTAKYVISTLPPHLLASSIDSPLSHDIAFTSIANKTHTWMGESIKVGLTYATPFWREKSSGTIFSNVGPIPEMYDHSNAEETHFGLMGFLNGAYHSVSKEERLEMILKQLIKYYGKQATDYLSYEETVWHHEELTSTPYTSHVLPHQNNGNLVFQKTYANGRFILAGTETSPVYSGYMEGAIRSAKSTAEKLKELFKQ
jgi:monoamine oxidase